MTLATLSVIPPMLPGTTIAALLGPLSMLALAVLGVTFTALLVGMVAENRDARSAATTMPTADVFNFPGRPRHDRAAA